MIWVHLCEWRDWKKKKEKEMVVGGTGSLSLSLSLSPSPSTQLWMTFLGVPRRTIIELDYFISPHQWKHRNLRKESCPRRRTTPRARLLGFDPALSRGWSRTLGS